MTAETTIQVHPSSPPTTAGLLGDLASDLAGNGHLPDLLKRFLEPLLRMTGADAGAVRAISADGDLLQLISCVGMPEPALPHDWQVHVGCGACGAAAADGTASWASDLSRCARVGEADRFGGPFRRMLAVPLRHRGRVLGVYNLFFTHDVEPDAQAAAVLKAVGEVLGLALNNARLEHQHLRATVMHERQMMAAEVHDSIAQTLAFVKMRLPLLEEAAATHDDERLNRYLGDLRGAVGEAHTSLRAIINEFRTPLDPRGLDHALAERVRQLGERHDIEVEWVNRAPGLELPGGDEAQVVHIVSEALSNIARHARARHAWLSLEVRDGLVEVRIDDDGRGPQAGDAQAAAPGHHGVTIMRERARRIGGQIELGPRAGAGTSVRLRFPLPRGVAS